MSYKIGTSGSLIVFTNTLTWDIEKIPTNEVWYAYNATDAPILYSIYQVVPERPLVLDQGYENFLDGDGNAFADDGALQTYLDSLLSVGSVDLVSTDNSTILPLDNGLTFTGEWENVGSYDSMTIAVKTDQNGTYTVQFSPDGVNQDSTLTRYYRTNQIEPPHRFTITRKFMRVTFTNDSGSNQTYLRLQVLLGDKGDLNTPLDTTLAQDFDSIAVRPTDYKTEVAIGRRQASEVWNKWGYNLDVDIGTEVIASWGGTFVPLTTATTISIVSTSGNDITSTGSGTQGIVLYGIDENRDDVIEVVQMNGTTPVVTTSTWLGLNRIAMFLCGTGKVNEGTITATAVTGGTIMGQMPLGGGVTQQCIFHVPRKHQFVAEWIRINTLNPGNKNATLTVKFWVYSAISNGNQEVYSIDIETQSDANISEDPRIPFPITASTVCWLECTSDKVDVKVRARFSGILHKDVDAIV